MDPLESIERLTTERRELRNRIAELEIEVSNERARAERVEFMQERERTRRTRHLESFLMVVGFMTVLAGTLGIVFEIFDLT